MQAIRFTIVASCAAALLAASALVAHQDSQSAPGAAPGTPPATAPSSPPAPKAYDSPWPQTATKDGITYSVDRPSFVALEGNQVQMDAPLQVTMSDGSTMSGRMQVSA